MKYVASSLGGARCDIVEVPAMMRRMHLAQRYSTRHLVARTDNPHVFLLNSHENFAVFVGVRTTRSVDSSYCKNRLQEKLRLFFCSTEN